MAHTARLQLRPYQYKQSRNAQSQTGLAASGNMVVAEEKGIEDQEPQRGDGDDQCGQAGGDGQLRIRKSQVAAHQQQQAYDRSQRDLFCRIENLPPGGGAHRQHDHARNRESHGAHQRRRNRLHRNVDGKVSRAPE